MSPAHLFIRQKVRSRALILIRMHEAIRKEFGFDLELIHDIHECVAPVTRFVLPNLEDYRLFFLEDPFTPEHVCWFDTREDKRLRQSR